MIRKLPSKKIRSEMNRVIRLQRFGQDWTKMNVRTWRQGFKLYQHRGTKGCKPTKARGPYFQTLYQCENFCRWLVGNHLYESVMTDGQLSEALALFKAGKQPSEHLYVVIERCP